MAEAPLLLNAVEMETKERKFPYFRFRVNIFLQAQTDKMFTRLSRLGTAFPRFYFNQGPRFVSQTKPSGDATSTAVTELHSAGVEMAGHGEVSQYVKVSSLGLCYSGTLADRRIMNVLK